MEGMLQAIADNKDMILEDVKASLLDFFTEDEIERLGFTSRGKPLSYLVVELNIMTDSLDTRGDVNNILSIDVVGFKLISPNGIKSTRRVLKNGIIIGTNIRRNRLDEGYRTVVVYGMTPRAKALQEKLTEINWDYF